MKLQLQSQVATTSSVTLTALALLLASCSLTSEDYAEAPATDVTSMETARTGSSPTPDPEGASTAQTIQSPTRVDEGAAESSGTTASNTPSDPVPAQPVAHATLVTSGRQLLDSCGQPFVVRGVEQIFGEQLPEGNDWVGLIEQIASSGVNAVRILVGDSLTVEDVDALITTVTERGMIAYISPYGDAGMQWLGRPEIITMLTSHERHIIIDAFGEPTFDDRERFISESTAAIRQVREWGYRVPVTVTANQFGRDLPSLLELGSQIIASDPLNNTILGWQAYWSTAGYYQGVYDFSLEEAIQAVAAAPFPIQFGLDRVTDFPSTATADFGTLLAGAEAHGVGWLWWDWYNPYGNENNLTEDGSVAHLTATGNTVINSHVASVQNTAQLPCVSAAPE